MSNFEHDEESVVNQILKYKYPQKYEYKIRDAVRKKRDYVRKIPKLPTTPPPVWETPVIKKKVGFIFHFTTSATFLVFTKKSQFLGG